jgi:hypothetical protein
VLSCSLLCSYVLLIYLIHHFSILHVPSLSFVGPKIPRYQFSVVFGATIWPALLFHSISERNNQIKHVGFLHRTSTVPSFTILSLLVPLKANVAPGLPVRGTPSVSTTTNYVLVNSVAFPIFNICAAKSERLLQQRQLPHLIQRT